MSFTEICQFHYQACFEGNDFFEENNTVLGAVAWSGYQTTHSPGVVLVHNINSPSPKIDYIPRKSLIKLRRRFGVDGEDFKVIENMVQEYKPSSDVVMVYVNNNNEMSITMQKTNIAPSECYETLHKEISSLD